MFSTLTHVNFRKVCQPEAELHGYLACQNTLARGSVSYRVLYAVPKDCLILALRQPLGAKLRTLRGRVRSVISSYGVVYT